MAKKISKKMSSQSLGYMIVFLITAFIVGMFIIKQANDTEMLVKGTSVSQGFDQFGYNYTAMVFSGKADGVDRKLDGTVWGDPTYANDHLVMKWSKGWNDARFNGGTWGPGAWEDNEWDGNVKGGSGVSEHDKIIWVGPQGTGSQYWRPGGSLIWGQFEIIMQQGTDKNGGTSVHTWTNKATPNGYMTK